MYKKLLSLSALALAFNLAQSNIAFANDGHHCDGHGYSHEILKKLDLTSDQKTKIKGIIEKDKQTIDQDHEQLKELRKQTNEEFIANKIDDAEIDKLVDKELPLVGDIMKIRLKQRLAISQVLTDAQKVKLAELMAKYASKEHKKHHD